MTMSFEDYKLRYEDLSNEELLDDLIFKAASRHEIQNRQSSFFKQERSELDKQIKAIKAVIMERMGGN